MKKILLGLGLGAMLFGGMVIAETDYPSSTQLGRLERRIRHALNPDDAVTNVAAGAILTADLATNAVTTEKITDGTIVNADISAVANITYTKLGTNVVVASSTSAGRVLVLFGSITGQLTTVTFSPAFALPPAMSFGLEAVHGGTGTLYATSLTTNGCTIQGLDAAVVGGWTAVGKLGL